MKLASIFQRYADEFHRRFGTLLSHEQREAFNAIIYCRTEGSGQLLLGCERCDHTEKVPHHAVTEIVRPASTMMLKTGSANR